MHELKLTAVILVLLTVGCATYSELTKKDRFEDTVKIYELAIRWSEFDAAAAFIHSPEKEKGLQEKLAEMERIKVTDYVVMKLVASQNESEIVQIVKISYYKTDNMVVKSLRDNQLWVWDADQKGWFLESGLPEFK
jgi:hypothetical protein